MKPARISLLLFSVFLSCGPRSVGTTSRAQIVQFVHAQLTAWTRAVNNRSLDTLELLYRREPDVTILWPDGRRTRGWNAAQAKWQSWAGQMSQLNFVIRDISVEAVTGNTGLATFRTLTDAVTDGQRTVTPGWAMQVWTHDPADGRWKIHAEQRADSAARD